MRLAFFVTLSVALLFADARFGAMELVRQVVGTALYPIQRIAGFPLEVSQAGLDYFTTLTTLQSQNENLIRQQLQDRQQLHQLETLRQENEKLRKLMNVGNTLTVKRSILSEIVSDARDPFSRKIILGKGLIHGVKEGMPVIDELGLLGQVTRAFPSRAEVSLITDKEQIIPVENLRNGVRSVAYGGSSGGLIELRFMANNSDIDNGDLLVTSGLDGVYPRGIPVARVLKVERNSRYSFASIFCEPIAGVDQHRFVLVLDTSRDATDSKPDLPPAAAETGMPAGPKAADSNASNPPKAAAPAVNRDAVKPGAGNGN